MRREPGRLLGAAALALVCAGPVLAAARTTALDFLRLDIGPREVGMGGTGVASANDAYAAGYNPALLASLRSRELAFSHANWVQGIQYQDLLYAHPQPWGVLSGRFQRLSYGTLTGYDAAGARTSAYSAADLLAGLNFARAFPSSGLAAGVGVKYVKESIGEVSASSKLLDLGAAFTPQRRDWLGDVTFGLALRNLGTSARFDTTSEPAPSELGVGVAGVFLGESLTAGLDGHFPRHSRAHGNLGFELWVMDALALRAGVEAPQDAGPGIRAGLGFRIRNNLQVDYAFSPLGNLGETHHIGARLRFGGPAEDAYQEGLRLMRLERYPESIVKFNSALNLNPKHPRAARRIRQAYSMFKKEEPTAP